MLERVIEERCRGDAVPAELVRAEVRAIIGDDLAAVRPGQRRGDAAEGGAGRRRAGGASTWRSASARTPRSSPSASRWPRSAPAPRSACIRSSAWSNPEPEAVLAVSADGRDPRRDARQRREPARRGRALGAAARPRQGQQRLLRARPAAAAVRCRLHAGRRAARGDHARPSRARTASGWRRAARSATSAATRRRSWRSSSGRTTSTRTARCCSSARPSRRRKDRGAPGQGFTHKPGDVVRIATPRLGALVNEVGRPTMPALELRHRRAVREPGPARAAAA